MATSEADRWFGDYPWQDASSTSWTVHAVLEDTEAALRKSASRLRSSGRCLARPALGSPRTIDRPLRWP